MTLAYPPFELEVDVRDWDTVAVTVYVAVPSVLPAVGGRYRIVGTTLSAGRATWNGGLTSPGIRTIGTGYEASVTLVVDVERAIFEFNGTLDIRVLGKSIPPFPETVHERWAYPWPKPPVRPIGAGQIAHVVVVMMENRSFDNLMGWLYADTQNRPPHNIPPEPTPTYDGLETHQYWCPRDAADLKVDPPEGQRRVYAVQPASSFTVPDPDPLEQFGHMTFQLFGSQQQPDPPSQATMKGFVVDYADAITEAGKKSTGRDPKSIMETYAPAQVPVLTALARNFAICDRWFASVPCQTWPNRAFVHAGTSCGRVNNLDSDHDSNTPPDPKYYNTKTIFNVLREAGVTWKVYADSPLPTLTRYQFMTQLGDPLLSGHFRGFGEFKRDAREGLLPAYSFVEPDFMIAKNDAHPPHDVAAGESFLYEVWQAVSTGAAWKNTLLVITFDEHGGCYDHVPPPWTAVKPDDSKPQKPFGFNRYGVRVPTIVVSPWVEAGTVFRARASNAAAGPEFDHASILATLRDWQKLANRAKGGWLKSRRIAAAPTLASVLTRTQPRTDVPKVPVPRAPSPPTDTPLNDIQRSVVAAAMLGSQPGRFVPAMYRRIAAQVADFETVRDALRGLGLGVPAPTRRMTAARKKKGKRSQKNRKASLARRRRSKAKR